VCRLTLLLLGLLLAPIVCWAAEAGLEQAKAIAEIWKVGGRITIDQNRLRSPVVGVILNGSAVMNAASANEGSHVLRSDHPRIR